MGMSANLATLAKDVAEDYLQNTQVTPVRILPAELVVEYWKEEDGSWAAHSAVLGVSAVADSEVDLIGEMADQVEEFWSILNERYETLDDSLKALLDLRGTALKFVRK
jgi:hypothetical protein